MKDKFEVIFLDGTEVIIHIYERDHDKTTKLLHHQITNLTPEALGSRQAQEAIEIIAEFSLNGYALHVYDWKICARNVSDEIKRRISAAIGLKIETITVSREQDLIMKGMLMELL